MYHTQVRGGRVVVVVVEVLVNEDEIQVLPA